MTVTTIPVPSARTFDFTLPGVPGVHSLPLMEYLPRKLVRKYMGIGSITDQAEAAVQSNAMMDELFSRYCPELDLDEQPMAVSKAIIDAWGEASNRDVTMGESSASSDSATSTGEPLNTTSSPARDMPSTMSLNA